MSGDEAEVCCGDTHPGMTHGQHMRRIDLRLAQERAREIADGVARAVERVKAGEPVTAWEAMAIRQAGLGVARVKADFLRLHPETAR